MLKASMITSATQKLAALSQKVATRYIIKQVGLPPNIIFARLCAIYKDRITSAFSGLKTNNVEAMLSRPNVSERIKGKVLVSLNKQQK